MSGSGVVIYRDEWALPQKGGSFERVSQVLFQETKTDLYGIFDGASSPDIYKMILSAKEDSRCLYRGELSEDLQLCAPYLVRLSKPSKIVQQLIRAMFEDNSGIIVRMEAGTDIDLVRRHFRRFLLVQTPEKKTVYFRYYDPRVLRIFLPTCDAEQLLEFFGPIESFVMEDEEGSMIRFSLDGAKLKITQLNCDLSTFLLSEELSEESDQDSNMPTTPIESTQQNSKWDFGFN